MKSLSHYEMHTAAQLLSHGVARWLVELLAELDETRFSVPRRVSPMFARIGDTAERDNGDRDEIKALKAALARLREEQEDEGAAVARLLSPATDMRSATPIDMAACIAGLNRVGQWVDAAMGD